jgi:hypothetical protein
MAFWDHLEVSLLGTCVETGGGTKNLANVFHFRRSAAGGGPTKANINAAFIAKYAAAWAAALSVLYVESAVTIRDITNNLDLPTPFTGTAFDGTVVGARLPMQSSVSLLLRTGNRGKSFRGGKRISPVAESHVTADEINGGALAVWNTLTALMVSSFTDADGNTWTHEVLSKTLSNFVPQPAVIVAADITSALLNKTIGTMRRRKERTVR